jgi:hypothetical protein
VAPQEDAGLRREAMISEIVGIVVFLMIFTPIVGILWMTFLLLVRVWEKKW